MNICYEPITDRCYNGETDTNYYLPQTCDPVRLEINIGLHASDLVGILLLFIFRLKKKKRVSLILSIPLLLAS